MLSLYSGLRACEKEALQTLVPEASNHVAIVTCYATSDKLRPAIIDNGRCVAATPLREERHGVNPIERFG